MLIQGICMCIDKVFVCLNKVFVAISESNDMILKWFFHDKRY